MPDYNAFWGSRGKACSLRTDFNRAVDIWGLIQDHPISIVLERGGVAKTAQSVLVVPTSYTDSRLLAGDAGTPGKMRVTLIGVRDHDVQPDLDILRRDTFGLSGSMWRVVYVDTTTPGMTRAICEAVQ